VAFSRMRDALQARIGVLEEEERQEQLSAWRERFADLAAVATLEKGPIMELLKALQEPPVPLGGEDLTWRERVTAELTARLDELSLDDLLERIARLSPDMRNRFLERIHTLI
jgi:hypothetical protein